MFVCVLVCVCRRVFTVEVCMSQGAEPEKQIHIWRLLLQMFRFRSNIWSRAAPGRDVNP